MGLNRPKSAQMSLNKPKGARMSLNNPKYVQHDPIWVQNGSKWAQMILNEFKF